MKSRRTISYIGLWALIMPWLGFSWETKTVLFSLTGILLLFIGNKHYHAEKSGKTSNPKPESAPAAAADPIIIAESIKVYSDVPEYMATAPSSYSSTQDQEVVNSAPEILEKPEPIYVKEEFYVSTPNTESTPVVKEEVVVTGVKPKQPRVRKNIEILPRFKRNSRAISLESLDINEDNEQI